MKKIRYIFCIILSLIQIYIPVSSFAGLNVQVDSDTGIASVSGSYESMANKRVTVQILAPGVTSDDISSLGSKRFEEIFANVFEVVADHSGEFELPSFKLESSGNYGARVTYAGAASEPLYVKNLCRYFSQSDKTLVDGYLKSSDSAGLFAYVDGHSDLFFSYDSLYKACSEQVRKELITFAMNTSVGASAEIFAQNLARVCAIYFASRNEDKAYESFMKFYDTACYEQDYTPLAHCFEYISEKNTEDIIKKYCKDGSVAKSEETLGHICDEIVLSAVKNAINQSFVEKILTDNDDYLGIDLADYKKLSDKRSVNKGLIELNAKTTSALISGFYELVADAAKPKEKPSGGGGAPQSGSDVSINVSGSIQTPDGQQGSSVVDFADMDGYEWAEEAVYALCQKGIINGVSAQSFAPASYVTREAFIKMLISAIYGDVEAADTAFEDVPKGSWYEKYVAVGYNSNIINGVSSALFGVGMNITRQDIATVIYRANTSAFNGVAFGNNMTDGAQISDYAREGVNALTSAGIVTGYADGSFRPSSFATRAEATVIIYRYLKFAERG